MYWLVYLMNIISIRNKIISSEILTNGMTDMNGGSSAPDDTYAEGGSNEDKLMSYFGRKLLLYGSLFIRGQYPC